MKFSVVIDIDCYLPPAIFLGDDWKASLSRALTDAVVAVLNDRRAGYTVGITERVEP